jgi:hypothetical protein
VTHPLIADHPAFAELNERARDVTRRKREIGDRLRNEERRFAREQREYADALARGNLDATAPTPVMNLGPASASVMEEVQAIERERREVVRREARSILVALDEREAEVLDGLTAAAREFERASRELKTIIAARQHVWGVETPGAPRVTADYPCEPTDVLTAVLDGHTRVGEQLPRTERWVVTNA